MLATLRENIYRTLRWSEQYTKTDMIYVARSGFWLSLNQGVGVLVSLILSILFANLLLPNDYGIYKYILSMAGFVSTFSLTGMNTVITRAVSQGREGTFLRSLPIQLFWTLPQFFLLLCIALYYTYQGNNIYGIAFSLIAVCGPITTVANSFAAYLQGKENFKALSLYSTYSSLFYLIAIVTALSIFPATIYLVATYFISTTAANVYFCYRTIRVYRPKREPYSPDDVAYAKELSVMNLVGAAASQVDSIIVYHLLGPAQLATYAFSVLIPDRLRSVFTIITSAVLPRFSLRSGNSNQESVARKSIQMTIIAVITIATYVLLAPFAYQLLFPQYLGSVWYSQVYSLSLVVLSSYITLPSLFAERNEKALWIINIGIPIIKVVLSLGLILWFEILGAIIAKILHYLLHAIVSNYYALKHK